MLTLSTLSLWSHFFTKSRTPCHEDGAVHILGGSSPPQLKLSGDTLYICLEVALICDSKFSQADNEDEPSESSYIPISNVFSPQIVMVVPRLLMAFSASPKPSSSLCRDNR